MKINSVRGLSFVTLWVLVLSLVPSTGFAAAFKADATLWPCGVIPYEYVAFGLTAPTPDDKVKFETACRQWEQVANVRFIPRNADNPEPNYILVQKSSDINQSYVGMK